MKTLTIDENVFVQFAALAAARGQDVNQFATTTLADVVKKEAARERGLAEGRALREGPARPHDADAIYKEYAAKYGLPDLSHLSDEELVADGDRIIAAMDPEIRAALERDGLI